MTTKQRFKNKYALQIRERDHNPPHVHLIGGSDDATISLETMECIGMIPADLKQEVLLWIKTNHNELMEEWKLWHT
ncbi:MAG: DUF4160 domain-containing protein [Steroidobacteraceae bacterium]|nr:DUF4160 domain-containing protein [Deltaproteobacteria bacterium]